MQHPEEVQPDIVTWHLLADGKPPLWASSWGEDNRYGPWCAFEVGGVEQRLRWIPPGRFWMGSPEEEEGRREREGPRHVVQLTRGFWMFDTPCTQGLWEAVMGNNPSDNKGGNLPVDQVSWNDVQEFLNDINEKVSGLELRLPTEAEWEHACRAGTESARYHEDLDRIAWYRGNSDSQTHPVKEKDANDWGLYDMLGNVWEWCADGLRDYAMNILTDPVGPMEAVSKRVYRGGCYANDARYTRSAGRAVFGSGFRPLNLGFRCASSGR